MPPERQPDPTAPARRARGDRRLVRLPSGDYLGVEGRPVEVQVNVSTRASPGFHIVGLPGRPTQESRERIRTAIQNAGYRFPSRDRILVNLAPAFQKKDGAVFDLPVALGILLATGQIAGPARGRSRTVPIGFLGELGLEGELRPVPGALLIATALGRRGIDEVVVPERNASEVSIDPSLSVLPARHLHDAVRALRGELPVFRRSVETAAPDGPPPPDFAEVRGQEMTKRGVLVAAAGGHNLLLTGPPGVGKTMLARRIPWILPPLALDEVLEVTRVYSAGGCIDAAPAHGERPFRAPHHTVSYAGLVGGGNPPRPGEISLAHRGVLFLDELPEFQRRVLETLRQPIEAGRIAVVRSSGTVVFPADFRLVAAMNPCPCGYAGHARIPCRCSPAVIERYRRRVSGPLLDRVDVMMEVDQPSAAEVLDGSSSRPAGLSTATMRERVQRAFELQRRRWSASLLNGQVPHERVVREGEVEREARRELEREAERRRLSARALGRVLRIARTVADLEECRAVTRRHIGEALGLRSLDG